jgi:hypothetical protein
MTAGAIIFRKTSTEVSILQNINMKTMDTTDEVSPRFAPWDRYDKNIGTDVKKVNKLNGRNLSKITRNAQHKPSKTAFLQSFVQPETSVHALSPTVRSHPILLYFDVYGRSARNLALLMATASALCFLAEAEEILRGMILPRSETNFCNERESL